MDVSTTRLLVVNFSTVFILTEIVKVNIHAYRGGSIKIYSSLIQRFNVYFIFAPVLYQFCLMPLQKYI